MLALPTAPVVPASAKRLFLLVTEGLDDEESRECEGARCHAIIPAFVHAPAGSVALGASFLIRLGDGGSDEVGRESGRSISTKSASGGESW